MAAPPRLPNILLVLADDLGYGDVGCYNPQARVRTPRLDALAREGVRFTDAHSPSSVCTPTRYGLLTGRYCWRTTLKQGVLNGESPSLMEPGRTTLASMLRPLGYRTGVFGKWHLGLGTAARTDYREELRPAPADFGFDEFLGIPASLDMPPYLFVEGRRAVELPTAKVADNGEVLRGPYWRGGAIAPSFRFDRVVPALTGRAVDFVRDARRPFFAYVPLPAPHTPWVPSAGFTGRSRAGLYGDFVEEFDDCVGRLVDAAPADTLVIVTSDNGAPWSAPDVTASGGHFANRDWRGQKADVYEAGHRVPFLVRWPDRARAGTVDSSLVCLTDVFATLARSVGRRLSDGEAEDSIPLGRRDHLVHHSALGHFSYRRGPWKLMERRGSGGFTEPKVVPVQAGEPEGELYHLGRDPQERQDLSRAEPRKVAELRAALQRVRQAGGSR